MIAMIRMLLLTRAQKSAGSAAQVLQPAMLASCAAVQALVAAHGHAAQPADALCCKEQLQMQQSSSFWWCSQFIPLCDKGAQQLDSKPEVQHAIIQGVICSKRSSCSSTKGYMHGQSHSRLSSKPRYALPCTDAQHHSKALQL